MEGLFAVIGEPEASSSTTPYRTARMQGTSRLWPWKRAVPSAWKTLWKYRHVICALVSLYEGMYMHKVTKDFK